MALVASAPAFADAPEKVEFFESKVRPLLLAKCVGCHGEKKQKGGLRLDSRDAWAAGGDSGAALVPGKPEDSLLIKAIGYREKDLRMPPDQALSAAEIAILTEWVKQGAVDPRTGAGPVPKPTNEAWEAEFKKRLNWWSLKTPISLPPPPAGEWGMDAIDRFILKGLTEAKLKPASAAEPETLLRRLSFVLTGLPPSPALREKYLKHAVKDANAAYVALVDELLASPHFGERFARHWMDVARYTDTYGYEWDNPAKGSHEYRDYLIRVFNGDLPFDRFLREQLAGDLLSSPRLNAALGINESLIGPMFLHMGEHRHGSSYDFNGVHQEMMNNKIEAFSKAFLGVTVACSRCHDHKLEAVSQRDYYALGAVFATPRWTSRVVDAPGKNDVAIRKLIALRATIRSEVANRWREVKTFAWQKNLPPKPVIEDVAYPLARLAGNLAPETWSALASEWRTARSARLKHNAAFRTLTDFTKSDLPKGWVSEGDGIRFGHVDDGAPLIALEGDAVFTRILPRGLHTHALSSKLPGAIRMPSDHTIPGPFLSLKLAGGQYGGYLEVHENAFQGEEVAFLNQAAPQWRTFGDKPLRNGITRITREFATSSLNPNFPPRTGLAAGLPHTDFGFDKRSWISITGIVSHDSAAAPQDPLDAFESLYELKDVEAWLRAAVARWCEGNSKPGDVAILEWLLANKALPNTAAPNSTLAKAVAEYRTVEAGIEFARTVNTMDERERDRARYALNVRGNVDAIGEMLAPDFLRMFEGRHDVAKSPGSGRLELAESLVKPDHPLTARVYVNRVWQWIMGTGLVATPDDFGRLGERPSHPELLDHLAGEFIRDGWSTKRLIRRLVLTETFRQSGMVSGDGRTRDPNNRLRHHYPTRRLEAEALRDSLLAVSGKLDPKLYGRPIFPPRVAEDPSKRLFAGPLDGHGRRSIYLQMSIMEPPKFLVGFNLPDLRLPTGKRDTTNVPAQALMLLNDPFVQAMAEAWSRSLVKARHASAEERVEAMFVAAFGRSATAAERTRWSAAAREWATADVLTDATAWARVGHAMFNAKEFLHYR